MKWQEIFWLVGIFGLIISNATAIILLYRSIVTVTKVKTFVEEMLQQPKVIELIDHFLKKDMNFDSTDNE